MPPTGGKQEYPAINPPVCCLVHHKSHMEGLGIEKKRGSGGSEAEA
jgi:hypothetical protein